MGEGQSVRHWLLGTWLRYHMAALLIWLEKNMSRIGVLCVWRRAKTQKMDKMQESIWDDTIHNTRLVINLKVMQMLLHGLNYLRNLVWFKVIVLSEDEFYLSDIAKIHSWCAVVLPKKSGSFIFHTRQWFIFSKVLKYWCLSVYHECRGSTPVVTIPTPGELLSFMF